MQICRWNTDQDPPQRCGAPATKSVVITGYDDWTGHWYEETVWLCDAHYADPETQRVWKECGFEWAY